jgi:hypothetical protein
VEIPLGFLADVAGPALAVRIDHHDGLGGARSPQTTFLAWGRCLRVHRRHGICRLFQRFSRVPFVSASA